MKKTFDDFTTQIQSDELAVTSADAKFNDWVNDFEDNIIDEDDGDIIND